MDNYSLRVRYLVNNKLNLISNNPNIVGMGYGYKAINNNTINVPSLTFLVRKKIAQNLLEPKNVIPKYINGVITDVVESGDFEPCVKEKSTRPIVGVKPCTKEEAMRPIVGGISIQNPTNENWGTVGYATTQLPEKKKLFILTSGHVLRSEDEKEKVCIIQPRYVPWEQKGSRKEVIGTEWHLVTKIITTSEKEQPSPDKCNKFDAGFLEVGYNTKENRKKLLDSGFFDKTKVTGVVPTDNGVVVDINVNIPKKESILVYGAQNGITKGIPMFNPFTYNATRHWDNLKGKSVFFKKQVVVKVACDYGDSGALGLLTEDRRAFGLLMRITTNNSRSSLGIFNPLDTILTEYDMELLE